MQRLLSGRMPENKLTVTRGELGGDNNGGGKREGFLGTTIKEHGQNKRGLGSRVGGEDGWGAGCGGGKMETTVLEQQ